MNTIVHFRNIDTHSSSGIGCTIRELQILQRECCVIYGLDSASRDILIRLATGAATIDRGMVAVLGTNAQECDEASWFKLMERIAVVDPEILLNDAESIGENLATVFQSGGSPLGEPALSKKVLWLAQLLKLTIAQLAANAGSASAALRFKARLGRAVARRPQVLMIKVDESDAEAKRILPALLSRIRRRLKVTAMVFTSSQSLALEIADRVLVPVRDNGDFIENPLRVWYHKLFPFMRVSRARRDQLAAIIANLENNRRV